MSVLIPTPDFPGMLLFKTEENPYFIFSWVGACIFFLVFCVCYSS